MTQLTDNPKNHIIIFPDKSRRFITEKQAMIILQLAGEEHKSIKIENAYYSISMIRNATIMPIEDYYQQYPDERPPIYNEIQTFPKRNYISQTALQGIIKGLFDFTRGKVYNTKKNWQQQITVGEQKFTIKPTTDHAEIKSTEKSKILLKELIRQYESHYGKLDLVKLDDNWTPIRETYRR